MDQNSENNFQDISSQFRDVLRLDSYKVVLLAISRSLFMMEGDYIQVREGAQKMVTASVSAATYKVAAAAALSSPNSMYVAMTPMAQSQGLKKNDKTVQRGRQSCDFMAKQQRKL
ncbi:hypothetical protein YC2023_122439 [Brassica napus]